MVNDNDMLNTLIEQISNSEGPFLLEIVRVRTWRDKDGCVRDWTETETVMITSENLSDVAKYTDISRYDINCKIPMIIAEINGQLDKWGREAAQAFGLSEEAYKNLKLGGFWK